ncbi:NAD(P)-binding protein [Rhizodiscina lignyota]|uniref:NAD(P)-binding protein n=1 Tax=Rhizodiscina lignyota TaxID=1504668 RepID=A0A9P4IFP3_9PEZI|nr:NAD(P)-binding protein [Rhizodiscina lignyota]
MSEIQFSGLFDLTDKVAVITGGSRGLGLYTATAFLHAGARKVILVSRKAEGPQGLNQAVQKLNALPLHGEAISIAADLSKPSEVERVVEHLKKTEEKIDILIANAAATWGGRFDETPDWAVAKVLDLNVRSVFNLVRLMAPLLEKAGKIGDPSRIVITGAGAGLMVPPFGPENRVISYGVSKAAAHHLARYLAVELGPRNIATNAIAPGFFPSKLANGLVDILGGFDAMAKANLLGRYGRPEDIAGVMLFLCSRAGSWVNGVVLEVTGGSHLVGDRPPSKSKL